MINYVTGDLFDSVFDFEAIGHGVNTRGLMGAGIARTFKDLYPGMYNRYRSLCHRGILLPGNVYPHWSEKDDRWIYNIASQDKPGPNARLEWLRSGLDYVRDHMLVNGLTTLGLPRIGSGIGGLDEGDVEVLVSEVFDGSPINVTIVTWG